MVFALFLLAAVTVLLWQAGALFRTGRQLKRWPTRTLRALHHRALRRFGAVIAAAIILLEFWGWLHPEIKSTGGALRTVHLSVDAACCMLFFIIISLRVFAHSPRLHGPLAYAFFGTLVAAAATGMALWYEILFT